MKKSGAALIAVLLFVFPVGVLAMTSTNFEIFWDSVNSGGDDISTSTNYSLRDTIGDTATGIGTSTNYQISAGYRVGDSEESALAITVGTQENQTATTWTSFSNAGNTVDLGDASQYSVDDFIGIVENIGAAQLIAVGKITNITSNTVTVDDWEGEPASLSANPSGGNDFAYRLGGSTVQFGVQYGQVATSLSVTDAVSNVSTGYSVSVQSGAGLQNDAGEDIQPVSDGAVTAGEEEYGGESVGTTAANPGGDFAFSSTSTIDVQTSLAAANHDRIGVIYKLSVGVGTPAGEFRQTIHYRLTPNY